MPPFIYSSDRKKKDCFSVTDSAFLFSVKLIPVFLQMQTTLIKTRIKVNNIHAKLLQMLILAQTETYGPTTHTPVA